MRFDRIATVLVSVLWTTASFAQSDDRAKAKEAADLLIYLCIAGGSVTVSRVESRPAGGEFRLESDKGSFTVVSRQVRGLVDGLGAAMNSLTADQANKVRECTRPYIPQILALVIGPLAPSPPPAADGAAPPLPVVPLPGTTSPVAANQRLQGVPVIYYLKAADGSQVTETLKNRGISFTQVAAVLPETLKTNAIWCAPGTPASAIQELALALTEGGIPVHAVERIRTADSTSTNRLLVISRRGYDGKPLASRPLSKAQIASISGCPEDRDNSIANFTRFENPRPTETRGDNRHVDTLLDARPNPVVDATASFFCKQRGLSDTVAWKVRRITGDNVVSVRLGDKSTCTGNCQVFSLIVCN